MDGRRVLEEDRITTRAMVMGGMLHCDVVFQLCTLKTALGSLSRRPYVVLDLCIQQCVLTRAEHRA
jgi:hypothetical protein